MNLKKRIIKLENRNGFKNESEREVYTKYAQLIDDSITSDDISNPDDYIKIAKKHFKPL